MQRDELSAWLRLALTPGIGPVTARRLLQRFGPPQALFTQPEALTAHQAQALTRIPEGLPALLDRTWDWLQQAQGEGDDAIAHAVVTLGDAAYPPALLATDDPPLLLYLRGARRWLRPDRPFAPGASLAMVGSRNPTAQGHDNARHWARALRDAGLTIVSGLAHGIDAAAHEGALEGHGDGVQPQTIAVVGTGLDQVYPRAHVALAERIARHGLLVSEYALGTPPLATNFPKRNRIISGLTLGTLVVEAAPASGSLITARLAAEQGREVFAIPGSIHAPQSRGCHALIRQGATLVETVPDVLQELLLPAPAALAAAPAPTHAANDATDPLLAALGYDPLGLDALQARTGYDTATLQARLLELELDGQLARLPGGLFQRLGRG